MEKVWANVKKTIGEHELLLGPYFSYQALHTPKHLLFTLARYKFAAKMLSQNLKEPVLELGCGEGLGTLMLAEYNRPVIGVDFDEKAIQHAKKTIIKNKPNISFLNEDFLGKKYGNFSTVISIDVIEHIPNHKEDLFLETIRDNLSADGFCLIGTPNITASKYGSKPSQEGHINLFDEKRLRTLMSKYFQHVFIFGANDEIIHTGFYPMCHYLLALCCEKKGREQ